MSVSEKESGIVQEHTYALEGMAAGENTFIFVRPTEYDSTVLIRAGYATKSMDVHHKSSNWGPMAGFVPCDPAFNKKCDGSPNPNEHGHKFRKASPTQLTLKEELLRGHTKISFKTDYQLVPNPAKTPLWMVQRGATKAVAKGYLEGMQKSGAMPQHKFCVAEPSGFGNKATLFVLMQNRGEWEVSWVEWDKKNKDTGHIHPLYVFAYPQDHKLVPVTGDYDLWMVAPHFKHFDTHAIVRIQQDSHGSSAASGYTLTLIPRMNVRCGRGENPVFNHGAEAQNYGFTQALDWNLVMFTPGGGSRMVRMNQMPGILGDLQQAGYLVVWNKRYGEIDPMLMGNADKRLNIGAIRAEMDTLNRELDSIRQSPEAKNVTAPTASNPRMPAVIQTELVKTAKLFEASRGLGLEQSRIYRFNRQLLNFLDSQDSRLRVLSGSDFSNGFRKYESDVRQLHKELQQQMVSATTGSGESKEAELRKWMEDHRTQIDRIKQYWAA